MANLDDVLIFVKVAEFESIKGGSPLGGDADLAGEPAAVGESRLGVSLRRRTTQRVTLTARGRGYFDQSTGPISDAPTELLVGRVLIETLAVINRARRR